MRLATVSEYMTKNVYFVQYYMLYLNQTLYDLDKTRLDGFTENHGNYCE